MTKKELKEKCRLLLDKVILTEEDKKFLSSLLLRHPNSSTKIGCGIKDFFVGKGCFWVVRIDNSTTDFSYRMCIAGKTYPMQDFSICCRQAVSEDVFYTKLKLFEAQNIDGFITCPISGQIVNFPNIHIDHHLPKFRDIVKSFIKENNIIVHENLFKKEDKQFGIQFQDINLSNRFREYHNKIATYRLLSKTANIKIG